MRAVFGRIIIEIMNYIVTKVCFFLPQEHQLSRVLPPSDYDRAELVLVSASRQQEQQAAQQEGPRVR